MTAVSMTHPATGATTSCGPKSAVVLARSGWQPTPEDPRPDDDTPVVEVEEEDVADDVDSTDPDPDTGDDIAA
jgi:hypothetical protein